MWMQNAYIQVLSHKQKTKEHIAVRGTRHYHRTGFATKASHGITNSAKTNRKGKVIHMFHLESNGVGG